MLSRLCEGGDEAEEEVEEREGVVGLWSLDHRAWRAIKRRRAGVHGDTSGKSATGKQSGGNAEEGSRAPGLSAPIMGMR